MRIQLVTSKYLPEYTGAAFRINTLYRGLHQETPDWSVQVLCGGIERSDRADYKLDEFSIHRIRSRASLATSQLGRLAAECCDAWETWHYLSTVSCDVIHTVGSSAVVAAAVNFSRARRIPLLTEMVTAGAVPDQSLPLIGRFHRPDLHRGAAIVAISQPLVEVCHAYGYSNNVWSRPNPVDTDRFFPAATDKVIIRREISPFRADDIVICSIAKFMPQKNQIFLLGVLSRLPERFKLLLAGPLVAGGPLVSRDREYFEALVHEVRERGLTERIHIVPEFVAADRYIKAADIFAAPSLEEGLGTPILEAQACAVPVIANAGVPAFALHVVDNATGFRRPLDPDAWADAAQASLMLDPAALNHAARAIAKQWSVKAIRQDYRRLLQHLRTLDPSAAIDVRAVLDSRAC